MKYRTLSLWRKTRVHSYLQICKRTWANFSASGTKELKKYTSKTHYIKSFTSFQVTVHHAEASCKPAAKFMLKGNSVQTEARIYTLTYSSVLLFWEVIYI